MARRQPVPLAGRGYEDIRRRFRWPRPERFNMGVACSDAQPQRRLALLHQGQDGNVSRYTFGDLSRLSNRLANSFHGLGLKQGDRVAVILPQLPETAITHLAAFKAGMISLPLSTLFGPDALRFRLADSAARAVVTDRSGWARLEELLPDLPDLRWVLVVDGKEGERVRPFQALLEQGSASFQPVDSTPDHPCLIIYTSGTTGPPKGVLHGHRVLIGQSPGFRLAHELMPKPGDLAYTPADWAWIGGLVNTLLLAWFQGVTMVSAPRRGFDPESALRLMADMGVRNVFLPTTALRMMLQCRVPGGLRLRSLVSGGEAQEASLLEECQAAFGLHLNESYGQTEADFVIGHCGGHWPLRGGTMGRAFPGTEAAVRRDDGSLAGPDEVGEVVVRSPHPTMLLGYWNRPEATADKFAGEWMRTGDLARQDEDGYFWFESRLDDVIKSSGYRIGPAEIEECLLRHPSVAQCAVVGAPDRVRGQVVMAYVILSAGAGGGPELEEELRRTVRSRLAAYEYPRIIEFVGELPMTTSGKVDRAELRRRATAGKEA
jgi:acetyl-CoA synthetase